MQKMKISEANNWFRANTRPNLTTIEEFDDFFGHFIEAHAEMEYLQSIYNRMKFCDRAISQCLADFAIAHPSICRKMPTQSDGAIRYEVTANGTIYSLVLTADGWVRENGEEKTQDFLHTLPKDWVKSTLELDVEGMKRYATGEEIAAKGLVQRLKPAWK